MRSYLGITGALLLALTFAAHAQGKRIQQQAKSQQGKAQQAAAKPIVAKGKRTLGMHILEAEDKDYDKAFQVAQEAGAQAAVLSLNWNDIEKEPGRYHNEYLGIADIFYPLEKTPLILVLRPIDTHRRQVPTDLTEKAFDDPVMIARFHKLLDYVFAQIPNLRLYALALGNEVDAALGTDPRLWEQYKTFYQAARDYARKKRPGLKVGVTATFGGALAAEKHWKSLNAASDVAMLTYYPLNADFMVKDPGVVFADFDRMVRLADGKPLVMAEVGYPSGAACKSSEAKQAAFVRNVFQAWDAHAAQIPCIAFSWQTDISREAAEAFVQYYGVPAPAFQEYLLTLGLRHRAGAGKDKPAFSAWKAAAKARGW